MISFEKALEIIIDSARTIGSERVAMLDSLNRILAEDVISDLDMPPFNKSAMDGFACRRSDLGNAMKVIETIPAGKVPQFRVSEGECSRIMTGAMVPDGADTVIMVEQTELAGDEKIRFTGSKTQTNIAYKAEDVKVGDVLLHKGQLISSSHIAIMAAAGANNPLVSVQPKVAILSTGDELVEPHQKPATGQIRNSNSWQLMAQVRAMGCIPHYMGIIPDAEKETEEAIARELAQSHLVLLTGGISMGEYDFVPNSMRSNKVEVLFQKVAVKPGRPTLFGVTDKSCVIGLPGNPVSSFINFELFVKPLLFKMMGYHYKPVELSLPMAENFTRKKADRLEWLPVDITTEGKVLPVTYHGSAHIYAVSISKALLRVEIGTFELQKEELVNVRPF